MAEPQQLGKYKVLEVLGKGAMGVVYKAHDPLIDRPVALKTVRKELIDQDLAGQIVARFKNEAQAAGRLTHPGIVAVYEYGEDDATAYMAMEFVEGRGLRAFLTANQRFPLPDVMAIMEQLLDALHYAHERGVVHRDIKPANIIVTPEGRIKVADFGIARIERSNLTLVGTVMGTPSYMSPEQYAGVPADRRADVFSSGVLLYELLTGSKPFDGPTEAVGYKICHEPHRDPSQINPQGVPKPFDAVIGKALAKKPEDRYASARDFAEALSAAYKAHGADSAAEATILNTRPPQPKERPDTTFPPTGWKGEELSLVEELLAGYVGPMARVLVRKTARTTMSVSELVTALAKSVPDERERKAFLAAAFQKITGRSSAPAPAERPASTEQPTLDPAGRAIDPSDVEKAAAALAPYVGPIAKVVAKRTAAQTRDLATFYRRLADQVSDVDDRARFLKSAGYED